MWFRVLTSFAHFVEYVILAVLVHTGITGKSATTLKESNTTYAAIAWAIAVVYATSDEIHQSFIPGRDSSILDFGIDAVGVFIGIFAIPAFVKWLQNKLQKQTKTQ